MITLAMPSVSCRSTLLLSSGAVKEEEGAYWDQWDGPSYPPFFICNVSTGLLSRQMADTPDSNR